MRVAEDEYLGDAQFIVCVDGVQVGGIQTATASHAAGAWEDVIVAGSFDTDPDLVSVTFLNDAWGGTSATDRNLYVGSLTFNNATYAGSSAWNTTNAPPIGTSATLNSNGLISFKPRDSLVLNVAEDSYLGDAQFIVRVDGQQVGGVQTATAIHAAGLWQPITLAGDFGSDPSQISVAFINDEWGGSAATDRNLYIGSITLEGRSYAGSSALNQASGITLGSATELRTNGQVLFQLSDTLTLNVAEDSYQGDADFRVLVNGIQVGGIYTATASHAAGAWQTVTISGDFKSNPQQVAVQFLNDAWNGTAATDRNLYVASMTLNGQTYQGAAANNTAGGFTVGAAAALNINGNITFTIDSPSNETVITPRAITFNSNQYITLGNKLQFDTTQSWSVSTEIDVTAPPPGPSDGLPDGGASLVFGNTNGSPYRGYELWLDDNGAMRVRIMSSFQDNNYLDVSGMSNIADGKMHFIGATYDGSSKAAGVKLYVDGVQEQTNVLSDTLSGSSASDGPMIIGNQLNGWQNEFQLRGKMFDFTLSNVARDAVFFAHAPATESTYDASTQVAFDFGTGSGTTVSDLSGHTNDGTLSIASMWS
ncbi:MAG: carbohydrate-binding domain-containing protein [Janthinobacterium lividum]